MKKLAYVLLSFLMGLAAAGILPAQRQDDIPGYTGPLMRAVQAGHSDIVDKLLAAGANVNATDEYGDTTPLLRAARAGHSDIVDKLLAAGANINAADILGQTSLMVAARAGHSDIVAKLLDKGADQTMQSIYGTALDMAKTDDIKKLIREIERKREAVGTALGELHYIPKDIAGEIESFTF